MVIAIIAILMSLLFPVIVNLRGNAMRVVCGNNLHQVGLVCHAYAMDNGGALPPGESGCPSAFNFQYGPMIDNYMKENQIPPSIWYCPAVKTGWRIPSSWMNRNTVKMRFNQFPLGYFYVGNPSGNSMHKFVKPVPSNINLSMGRYEFVFDICSAPRTGVTRGSDVKRWSNFPHFSRFNPDGAQVLMGNFSTEYRQKDSLTLGYKFYAPSDVFW